MARVLHRKLGVGEIVLIQRRLRKGTPAVKRGRKARDVDRRDIVADVNAALSSNDRAVMLTLAARLDGDNNLGCPLN
jgi:hypothetical protein